jgi:hypothetical protein
MTSPPSVSRLSRKGGSQMNPFQTLPFYFCRIYLNRASPNASRDAYRNRCVQAVPESGDRSRDVARATAGLIANWVLREIRLLLVLVRE